MKTMIPYWAPHDSEAPQPHTTSFSRYPRWKVNLPQPPPAPTLLRSQNSLLSFFLFSFSTRQTSKFYRLPHPPGRAWLLLLIHPFASWPFYLFPFVFLLISFSAINMPQPFSSGVIKIPHTHSLDSTSQALNHHRQALLLLFSTSKFPYS